MDQLLNFIRYTFKTELGRDEFCRLCGTTWGNVKKSASNGQLLREAVCINFEREVANLGGSIKCEQLRADVDWQYLRGTDKQNEAA